MPPETLEREKLLPREGGVFVDPEQVTAASYGLEQLFDDVIATQRDLEHHPEVDGRNATRISLEAIDDSEAYQSLEDEPVDESIFESAGLAETRFSRMTSDTDTLGFMIARAGPLRILRPAEVASLAMRVEYGDQNAKRIMVEHNLKLVISMAVKRWGVRDDLVDLIQDGNLGLIRAVERFDYRRGLRFSTYATWWIKQAMQRSIDDKSRTIRAPVHMREDIRDLMAVEEILRQEHKREPSDEEILEFKDRWTPERLANIRQAMRTATPRSIDQPDSDEPGSESPINRRYPDHDVDVESEAVGQLFKDGVARLLGSLSTHDQQFMRRRYGLNGETPMTLQQLARLSHKKRDFARRRERRILKKLAQHPDLKSLQLDV